MLSTDVKLDFLDLFHHDIENLTLKHNNRLNLFTLGVSNNAFKYDQLVNFLVDKLYYFALSRVEAKEQRINLEYLLPTKVNWEKYCSIVFLKLT